MKCWLQISSGRGPAECSLLVSKIIPLILKEAEAANVSSEIIDTVEDDEPGTLKSALLSIEAEELSGFIAKWSGTIQWIMPSPFRPKHKRKNWFIGIEIIQPVEATTISEKDLLFETMRSSGPGGQNVNKTETAVRVKHIPTGIVVVAREERSQYLNKKLAVARLSLLLKEYEENEKNKQNKELWQQHNELERGNPLRVFSGPEPQEKLPV